MDFLLPKPSENVSPEMMEQWKTKISTLSLEKARFPLIKEFPEYGVTCKMSPNELWTVMVNDNVIMPLLEEGCSISIKLENEFLWEEKVQDGKVVKDEKITLGVPFDAQLYDVNPTIFSRENKSNGIIDEKFIVGREKVYLLVLK